MASEKGKMTHWTEKDGWHDDEVLDPCPICNSTVSGEVDIHCKKCDLIMYKKNRTRDELIIAWNTRVDRWIPVTEGLPEKTKEVLLVIKRASDKKPVVVFGSFRTYAAWDITHYKPIILPE